MNNEISINQPLEVMSADGEDRTIGFVCYEKAGCPIYKAKPDVENPSKREDFDWNILTKPEDLSEGDLIASPTILGDYCLAKVGKDENGWYAESESSFLLSSS